MKIHDKNDLRKALEDSDRYTLENIDTSELKDASFLFYMIDHVPQHIIDRFDFSSVENARHMFANTTSKFDISNLKFKNLKCTDYMFHESSVVGDLNKWEPLQNLVTAEGMFAWSSIKNFNIGKWNVSNLITKLPDVIRNSSIELPKEWKLILELQED